MESLLAREVTFGMVPVPVYPAKVAVTIGSFFILVEMIIETVEHH